MKITPETKPIWEIFSTESKIRYVIPTYQRNYSWRDANIEELFDDINSEPKGYYVGNLLVTPSKDDENNFDIVDGQQRMTTIALFFLGILGQISELLDDKNISDNMLPDAYSIQADIKRKLFFENESDLKLILQDPDSEIYRDLISEINNKNGKWHRNRTFGKRFKFISEKIKSLKEFSEIKDFYDKLNNVEILRISVGDLSDAYAIFQSLNAKGVPLTLIDLLKTEYLKISNQKTNNNEPIEKWNKLMNIFIDKNDDPDSSFVTQFLLNNYDAFEQQSDTPITKTTAYKKYSDVFLEKGSNYIDELTKNAKLFSVFSDSVENQSEIKFSDKTLDKFNKLGKLDSTQSYPVLLFALKMLEENRSTEDEINKLLDILTNFYIRRNITQKPKASSIRSKIIEIKNHFEENGKIDIAYFNRELNSISESKEAFELALKNDGVYDVSKNTTRVVLLDIESKFGKGQGKDEYPINGRNDKGNYLYTIEHIFPQTPNLKNGWDEMLMSSSGDGDDIKELQQSNIHKFGNLTLTAYNSEMSDNSFREKVEYKDSNEKYKGLKNNLFLNQLIVLDDDSPISKDDFESRITKKNAWTIDDINKRNNIMAKIILELYPL